MSRSEAVALLEEAAARFDDDVVFEECERRSAELDAHPERAIPVEKVFEELRKRFPQITESPENELEG